MHASSSWCMHQVRGHGSPALTGCEAVTGVSAVNWSLGIVRNLCRKWATNQEKAWKRTHEVLHYPLTRRFVKEREQSLLMAISTSAESSGFSCGGQKELDQAQGQRSWWRDITEQDILVCQMSAAWNNGVVFLSRDSQADTIQRIEAVLALEEGFFSLWRSHLRWGSLCRTGSDLWDLIN